MVEYSVQDDHLHLIVEADDKDALARGMKSYKKHHQVSSGVRRIDPCSPARWFTGWNAVRASDDGLHPSDVAGTVLLRSAWQKHGLIDPGERPRAPS